MFSLSLFISLSLVCVRFALRGTHFVIINTVACGFHHCNYCYPGSRIMYCSYRARTHSVPFLSVKRFKLLSLTLRLGSKRRIHTDPIHYQTYCSISINSSLRVLVTFWNWPEPSSQADVTCDRTRSSSSSNWVGLFKRYRTDLTTLTHC